MSSRQQALERLGRGGGEAVSMFDDDFEDAQYEEVDEETYQRRMGGAADDFVVDDDGFGYAGNDEDDEEGDGAAPRRRAAKDPAASKKRAGIDQVVERSRKARETAPKKRIATAFLNAASKTRRTDVLAPGALAKDEPDHEDEDFEAMLKGLTSAPLERSSGIAGIRTKRASDVALFGSSAESAKAAAAAAASRPIEPMRLPANRHRATAAAAVTATAAGNSTGRYNQPPPAPRGRAADPVVMQLDFGDDNERERESEQQGYDGGDGYEHVHQSSEAAAPRERFANPADSPSQPSKRRKVDPTEMPEQPATQMASFGGGAAAAMELGDDDDDGEDRKPHREELPQAPERSTNVPTAGSRKVAKRVAPPPPAVPVAASAASATQSSLLHHVRAAPMATAAAASAAHAFSPLAGHATSLAAPEGNDWWSVVQRTALEADAAASDNKPSLVASMSDVSGAGRIAPRDAAGNVTFFWLDAFEDPYDLPGTVFVFGKVDGASLCLRVNGVRRQLFFLPREDDPENPREIGERLNAVQDEVHDILGAMGCSKFVSRPVMKKYAFELPDVPMEATTYLEVQYDCSYPRLDPALSGRTFSHVFGTQTSALERLIVERQLRGPCWVSVANAVDSKALVSWAKYEIEISALDALRKADEQPPPPPLRVMSLSMKTVLSPKSHTNEIVMVSALMHESIQQETATPDPEAAMSHFSAVRSMDTAAIPFDFQMATKGEGLPIEVCLREVQLLNYLVAKLHLFDPDLIVGHNFLGFDLDVLLHRLKANKVPGWSKLGRLRRNKFPKLQTGPGGGGDSAMQERTAMAGRLVCDTWLSSKELTRQNNYTLGHLSAVLLGIPRTAIDMPDLPSFFASSAALLDVVRHTENDAYLQLRLMLQLLMIPLSKQLTSLSGSLWARTLQGGRAQRNEYLLLHEFFALGYLVPDKIYAKTAPGAKKGPRRKKAAYAGGLVLEPKRGFYDEYILLLDFNSLYPSIIQEYNLCFTTVARKKEGNQLGLDAGGSAVGAVGGSAAGGAGAAAAAAAAAEEDGDADAEEEELLDVDAANASLMAQTPAPGTPQGVLPRLLKGLVESRRVVKGLLKQETDPLKKEQYDIRQKALKLTANSMYGCLGFTNSRFYCKPIASLITALGRSILQKSVELTTQLTFEVVYGDTDSIMVNTHSRDLAAVKEIGKAIKREVNSHYKLLELEIDGVFKSLLLLKKKKYAALSIKELPGGQVVAVKELKGLELVRRDWCELSKDAGNFCLDRILDENGSADDVVDRIQAYLTELGARVRANAEPLSKFVITKGLTKAPEDYGDAKSQPHVQVALRMRAEGRLARQGDFIPYVITTGVDGLSGGSPAERAFHPDEIVRAGGGLAIDFEWYLQTQIHPSVSRIVEVVQGMDAGRVAGCLGLDAARFNRAVYTDSGADAFAAAKPEVKFADCERVHVTCPDCGTDNELVGPLRHLNGAVLSGLVCVGSIALKPSPLDDAASPTGEAATVAPPVMRACGRSLPFGRVWTAVQKMLRAQLTRYYDAWYECDEASCGNRTRQLCLRGSGRHCLVPGCAGNVTQSYPPHALYTQLLYYQSLFNVPGALSDLAEGEARDAATLALSLEDNQVFAALLARVRAELGKNAYYFVSLGSLFAICDRAAGVTWGLQ